MNVHRCAVALIVIGSQTVADDRLWADDTPDTIKDLKQQIEQLDQKVRILERNRELEKETAASYAAGIFNGVGDARNSNNADFEDDKEFAARLFLQPLKKSDLSALKGLGFGAGGSYGDSSSTGI